MTSTNLDLAAMMEDTLDAIPEAPDFVTPPPGTYALAVSECKLETYKAKPKGDDAGGDRQRLRITYTIQQTTAVAGNEPPVPDGSMFSETFMGTEQGLGFFKKRIRNILNVEDTAGVSLKELMMSAKGAVFNARVTIKQSANPNDPNKPYENVQIQVVAPE